MQNSGENFIPVYAVLIYEPKLVLSEGAKIRLKGRKYAKKPNIHSQKGFYLEFFKPVLNYWRYESSFFRCPQGLKTQFNRPRA